MCFIDMSSSDTLGLLQVDVIAPTQYEISSWHCLLQNHKILP